MNPAHEATWDGLLTQESRCNHRLYHRLAYGVLRDSAAAEDACQQAFLQAWSHRDGLRDPGGLRGWLCRTVVNQSVALLRKRGVDRRAVGCLALIRPDHEPAGRELEDGELARWALAQLDEPERTIVALRIIEGVPGNEVKRLMGCSASEVSRRLHQGLEKMRACLAAMEV